MKILSIIRHAKSSWEYPDLSDFERPLIEKGVRRTKAVAEFIKQKDLIPNIMLSSGAKRAFSTAELLMDALDFENEHLLVQDAFYPGSSTAFLKAIQKVENHYDHVMIIGHNPAITDFVSLLDPHFQIDWVKTSGLLVFKFEKKNWRALDFGKLKLLHNVIPKELIKGDIN